MTRFLVGCAALVALGATAAAQGVGAPGFGPLSPDPNNIAITSFDPDDAIAPTSVLEGPGVKIGEGTVLHPVFGAETGYISNVFYEQSNPQGAGVLRLIAQIGTGSLTGMRLDQADTDANNPETNRGDFQYRADLRASYDVLFAGNSQTSSTGGLGLGASFHGLTNPMGRLSVGMDEDFARLIRAANFETDANTDRDINNLTLKLIYHPVDHSLGGYLYYNNTIDVFERSQQNFADRMFNRIGLHPTWQWLPRTQIYGDFAWGVVQSIGSASGAAPQKVTSYPLSLTAGIATLLSIKTTLNVFGGYTNGFYSSGPNFSAPQAGVSLGYRYSPLGRIMASYMLQYNDSINANYYRDHVLMLSLQQLVDPLVIVAQPEVHFREYNGVNIVMGPPTRDDTIFALVAGVQYNFRNWIAASLNYRLSDVQTDYRYMPIGGGILDNPSYVRHELLLGLRVAM